MELAMLNKKQLLGSFAIICGAMIFSGCVERRLTIVTEPEEAIVWLNDEEIGVTPVTVNFNWYGDYSVRIEKPGYEILNTHRCESLAPEIQKELAAIIQNAEATLSDKHFSA